MPSATCSRSLTCWTAPGLSKVTAPRAWTRCLTTGPDRPAHRVPEPAAIWVRVKASAGARQINIQVLASEKVDAHAMFVVNTPADPLDADEFCRPPEQDFLSEHHLALLHRWLNVCASEHRECRALRAPARIMHTGLLTTLDR